MSKTDVSVVIPAFGECPHLTKVLKAILRQSIRPIEIIIVHSGEHDPTQELTKLDKSIRVIHRNRRTFAGDARNIGLAQITAPWVAFIDSDVIPAPDWLSSLLNAAQEGTNRFVVGSVGYAKTGGFWGLSLWTIEFSGVHPYLPDGLTIGGASANMLLSVEAFNRAAGFPSNFAASEDSHLSATLRELGFTNWFCASAQVNHFNKSGILHFLGHLFWLGRWGAICRKVKQLPGFLAVKFWPFAAGLWVAKLMLIYYRTLRWGSGYRIKLLTLTPGVVVGLLVWNLGFLSGLVTERQTTRVEDDYVGTRIQT